MFVPSEGTSSEITADVTYSEGRDRIREAFQGIKDLPGIDVSKPDAQSQIESRIEGCDAVIACIGSRQPSKPERWLGSGSELVISAMKAQGVSRLVMLSSMGIGDDFLPVSFLKVFWAGFLRVAIPSAHKDLLAMEKNVRSSELDYLLVRPMGLTPEEPPKGKWDVLDKKGKTNLSASICKEDVASFMLQQALNPTYSKTAVTVGHKA
eukprot:scaffold150636_cov45-Prasinocladus_malaysianus.AAC.1